MSDTELTANPALLKATQLLGQRTVWHESGGLPPDRGPSRTGDRPPTSFVETSLSLARFSHVVWCVRRTPRHGQRQPHVRAVPRACGRRQRGAPQRFSGQAPAQGAPAGGCAVGECAEGRGTAGQGEGTPRRAVAPATPVAPAPRGRWRPGAAAPRREHTG
jgi:hypothetical protein